MNSDSLDFESAYTEWKGLIKQERLIEVRKQELREIIRKTQPPRFTLMGFSPRNAERDEKIIKLYETGKTLREIGDAFGISHQRVSKILMRMGVDRRQPQNKSLCKAEGCEQFAKTRGYCKTHYQRVKTTGSADAPVFRKYNDSCLVEGCSRPYKSSGMCNAHRTNFAINLKNGNVSDIKDYLNVQKAKKMMDKQKPGFNEIRLYMDANRDQFK